jgi:ornithine decarboxylase
MLGDSNPPELQSLRSVEEFIRDQRPDCPVLCMSRRILRTETGRFLSSFPGRVLYAVKCNPHAAVLRTLIAAGITDFDVASLPEILAVKAVAPAARCYFNHPVKTADSIRAAYWRHGVTDFVVDSLPELEKVLAETEGAKVTIQLRLKVVSGSEAYDFSSKFGLTTDCAGELVKIVCHRGVRWALSFHVGSQCETPDAYVAALEIVAAVMSKAGTEAAYVNVGGGFPALLPERPTASIETFFDAIRRTRDRLGLPALMCEPGRALVWRAGTLVTQVVLRNGDRLYLNDGVYGSLGEINFGRFPLTARVVRPDGRPSGIAMNFQLFGPTCDSFDALDQRVALAEDVRAGDWLMMDGMGAYSIALANRFNGFTSECVQLLDSE